MSDETKRAIKLFPYRPGLATGNIVWAERNMGNAYYRVSRFAMRAGRFPPTHPVSPGDGRSNERSEIGTSQALVAFRARGKVTVSLGSQSASTYKQPAGTRAN